MKSQDYSLGFIGLGRMGREILPRIHSLFPVRAVYNRTRSVCSKLHLEGITCASTPSELAETCNIIFLSLTDTEAVESILFGDNGVSKHPRSGLIIVDLSTISLEGTLRIQERLARSVIKYLDSPVIGSVGAAKSGTLTSVCGGEESAFNLVRPLLTSFSNKIFYLGASGNGIRMKLINNAVMGINMSAIAEALNLSGSVGLSKSKIMEVLLTGGASSRILELKRDKIERGDFFPEFSLEHQLKDLRYAVEMARNAGLNPAISTAAEKLYAAAAKEGLGKEDMSAVASGGGAGAAKPYKEGRI